VIVSFHEHADDVLSLLPDIDREAPPVRMDPEVEWLDALRLGDDGALTRLYREHHRGVRALVRRLLGPSAEVEDVVHDVFVAAPAAFRGYRGEGTVRAFVFSIAVHHVRHHVRAASRRRSWLDRFRLAPRDHASPPTPEAQSQRRELAERLQRALATLSFEHRATVVLCELEEMTSSEAAEVLGVPEGTIRTRLFHAKKKLRALLEEDAHG
jgi:RNA polymerase sigma-70 factor (ECF subfamily)